MGRLKVHYAKLIKKLPLWIRFEDSRIQLQADVTSPRRSMEVIAVVNRLHRVRE